MGWDNGEQNLYQLWIRRARTKKRMTSRDILIASDHKLVLSLISEERRQETLRQAPFESLRVCDRARRIQNKAKAKGMKP